MCMPRGMSVGKDSKIADKRINFDLILLIPSFSTRLHFPVSNDHHSFQNDLFNPDLVMEQLFQELCFFRFVCEDYLLAGYPKRAKS